jgi:signal transduction histidine kinase/DNA-binding response OmpR family regulator
MTQHPALDTGQPEAGSSSEKVNVLVVDDQPDKLLALEAALSALGENVVIARSGRDALRRLLEQDFAVILLDVNMPDIDGFETASLIRQHRRCKHTPIIFVTAYGDDLHAKQGYSLGAVDYILSPIVPEILCTKVRVFVDLFRKSQAIERHAEERIHLAREQAARAAAEDSIKQLKFLAEATAAMTRHLSLDATVAEINRVAVPFLADFAAIVLLDDQGRANRCDAAYLAAGEQATQLVAVSPEEYWTGLPTSVQKAVQDVIDQRTNPICQASSALAAQGQPIEVAAASLKQWFYPYAVLPLAARGHTIGAMILAMRSVGSAPSVNQLRLAEDYAGRAGIALDNVRLFENIREHDRRKDHFLAMLGHELRNPLAPIRNAVEILRWEESNKGARDEEGLARVREMIDRQVVHMTRLIDDLLDVSRIANGKIRLRKERCDLTQLVVAAVGDHRAAIEQAAQELTLEAPSQPLWINGDPTRLSQVIGNLIHNAHKFTDRGGRVIVRLKPEHESRSALLTVRDTGIGMDRETVRSVFQAFAQADRSLERSRGGLGLGLALVKGLVELHGGTVCVSSEGLGKGTEFRVQLCLDESVPVAKVTPSRAPAKGRSCRVLVVEDNLDGAESMRLLLKHLGHDAKVAHSGPAGVSLASEWLPEVVLCDIGLPGGMDGYAVARALRENPQLEGRLLVALTGYGRGEDQLQAKEAGFDRHMTKPVDFEQLRTLIESHSSGSDKRTTRLLH